MTTIVIRENNYEIIIRDSFVLFIACKLLSYFFSLLYIVIIIINDIKN